VKQKTVGVSPKLIAATVTAIITYLLGQEVLELPPAVEVIGQAVLVALAAYIASPGLVVKEREPDTTYRPGVSGYSLVEVLVILFVALLLVLVLLAVLERV
jgi:hypothetical protein